MTPADIRKWADKFDLIRDTCVLMRLANLLEEATIVQTAINNGCGGMIFGSLMATDFDKAIARVETLKP